jgi:hypothetical protein
MREVRLEEADWLRSALLGPCPDGACGVIKDGRAMYYDSNHHSLFGSSFLTGLFRSVLEQDRAVSAGRREARGGG